MAEKAEKIVHQLEVYQPYREQLAIFKEDNANLVFDYEDKNGNKEARSHVHTLRKAKAAIEKARVDAKKEHLETGRKIDAEAKEITAEIEDMIEVHWTKIKEIEQREKDRIELIEERIEELKAPCDPDAFTSDELKEILQQIKAIAIDDSFEEFANKAATCKDMAVTELEKQIEKAVKAEEDAAELARLKAEEEERERLAREEEIRQQAIKEAEEKAEREAAEAAEAAANRERELQEKAEREKQEEIEKAEKAELELKLERERAEKERAEAELREQKLKEEKERLEREAREKSEQTKKVQNAVKELSDAIESASGKVIELKLTTAKTLLKELEI